MPSPAAPLRRRTLLSVAVAALALHCRSAATPVATLDPPLVAPSTAPAVAPIPSSIPPAAPSYRAIVLAGPHGIENAAWTQNGAVAVTHTELWRFRPEEPATLHTTDLSHPLGPYGVLGASPSSTLIAAGLEDGSVDVFRENRRLRTLPPAAKDYPVLDLRVSPEGRTLAVTRTGPTWLEETVLYDMTSGAPTASVQGGSLVFDETGAYVAARGGVYAVADGRLLAPWREGFFVLRADGTKRDIKSVPLGEEVMAGDYVARGFFQGAAFYAGAVEVDLVTPQTGSFVKIAASCAPSTKLSSAADAPHGRVIGVCTDGVLLTDLASRTTTAVRFPVQKPGHVIDPRVLVLPDGRGLLVEGLDFPGSFVDLVAMSARPATDAESGQVRAFATGELCARAGTARTDIACQAPALRGDGLFRLRVREGLAVTNVRAQKTVIEWSMGAGADFAGTVDYGFVWHRGGVEIRTSKERRRLYRLGAPMADVPEPFPPTAACGKSDPWMREGTDAFAVYTAYDTRGGQGICLCSAQGCVQHQVPAGTELLAASDGGAWLVESTNSTMTETTLRLERPGKASVRTKIAASCIHGTFGPKGHVFLACEANERDTVFELSPVDLSILGRRTAPPIGRADDIQGAGDDLLVTHTDRGGLVGVILPPEWVGDASTHEHATLYAWPTFGIVETADGKIAISGDEAGAAAAMRCFDGARLRPFASCADAVIAARP